MKQREGPGVLLLFTVDTECSVLRQPSPAVDRVVDELIFGDFGGKSRGAGVGLHMDLLERFGFRGSFFVDVLMEFEHGQQALERTIEAIVQRGHEVELHVHPEHLQWSRSARLEALMRELSGGRVLRERDAFRRLMELSVQLFERRAGRLPIAYRAGAYRISDLQFPVLEEFGIRIDSSVQPFFNSQVSDWMRTRTQPFRVGGVLEAPPTHLILDERPGAWETRGFTPNTQLGDPAATLPRAGLEGAPYVATFVSHSFQLLRRRDSDDPQAVEDFERRLRTSIPAGAAERHLADGLDSVRTFGPELDEDLVEAVAGILHAVAERPDARCITYAELAVLADRFWSEEVHPPIDPVPTVNRHRGRTGVTGTRVYGLDLLTHLSERPPPNTVRGPVESSRGIGAMRGPSRRRVRFRPLGIAPTAHRGALPPLAEVLFPIAAIEAVAQRFEIRPWKGLPWDGATFKAWLEGRNFKVVAERAILRPAKEVGALHPFARKLVWLDREALETEILELELRPAAEAPLPPADAVQVDPTSLPATAAELYGSLHPGEMTRLTLPELSYPATRTTRLLALLRAGLEIVGREGDEYILIRPLDLSDIRRFAGI